MSESEHVSTMRVRQELGDLLNRVSLRHEQFVIERKGKPLAALVPVEVIAFLEELEDRLDLEEAREVLRKGGKTSSWAKVKQELGL